MSTVRFSSVSCAELKLLTQRDGIPKQRMTAAQTDKTLGHKITQVGGCLWGSSRPTPLPTQGPLEQVPKTVSRQLLIISKNGDSTTFLGNLCQCSVTLTVKKAFFSCSDRTSCVSGYAHHLWSCHWAPLRKAWLTHLHSLSLGIYAHRQDPA